MLLLTTRLFSFVSFAYSHLGTTIHFFAQIRIRVRETHLDFPEVYFLMKKAEYNLTWFWLQNSTSISKIKAMHLEINSFYRNIFFQRYCQETEQSDFSCNLSVALREFTVKHYAFCHGYYSSFFCYPRFYFTTESLFVFDR